jgi:hypothetical protein
MRTWQSPGKGRIASDSLCREIYDRIKRERFYYTFEPVLSDSKVQKIRTPEEIGTVKSDLIAAVE